MTDQPLDSELFDLKDLSVYVVIVAGGKGLRMESDLRKQYINLSGTPVIVHTLNVFCSFHHIKDIVLVVPETDILYCNSNILIKYDLQSKVQLVPGGEERQNSVMMGLKKLESILEHKRSVISKNHSVKSEDGHKTEKKEPIVLIHDGVRPFVDHALISRVLSGAVKHGASIPVLPVVDTLKKIDENGFIVPLNGTLDRKKLYRAQTPQAFTFDLIMSAHKYALINGFSGTDDAALVESLGKKVFVVQGDSQNIKITTREDLRFAEYITSRKPDCN
ncbi:2-C-methyl-D-erythritol 4-phosphate cytidylyltransferase [Desulfamplus magnetovallimortis]|uniref:2-C-methyl-D-erythritol 4-phosphate cytidylyltransferase n=1 Tax=Desulfamplus magnetovallimortis TaxID=1246637 RepID=L0R5J0_9BACT|nr:2-C-methyl-D-erythritol 4-phosphate cytidylyltransferase [Desulfamplus magnetovallimortis]CCO06787.1 2-C-methyl-D-erythritol 4-phosphate cytidylyltransferase [Desulfamplus magnetovallimortis BW-1]SLM32838.1 2-C-methyl-D-erythritol 4-phosphate cytidylyltransferase [Desulfamplus magnetovallimortis]